jgi:hypothetical protein
MQKIAVSTDQMIEALDTEGMANPKEPSGAALLWTHEQVALVAEAIYEQSVRSTIETPENLGQFLTLEVETGNYCLASNMVDSILPLKQQYPLGRLFTLKVGYPTAASFGGLDDPIAAL